MTETPTGHRLVVEQIEGSDDDPEYTCTVVCLNPAHCYGWEECTGEHKGYDPDSPVSSAYDKFDEDVEIHGVLHEWKHGYGWCVRFDGCVVADHVDGGWTDSGDEIAREHGVGTYEVDDEWYDATDLTLLFVSRIPAEVDSPLPLPHN